MLSVVGDAQAVLVTRSDPTSALSALVAMHCAKAVLGVQSAAATEVQVDGVTGRLVPPRRLATAVRETLTDEFRLLAWGFAGLDRVSNRYAPEQVGRSITQAYDRVAS
jgi:glycosyltransferase involved in cell wall biosynthesis